MEDDPLLKFISPLAGVVLAVVLSVVASAFVASRIGDTYGVRVMIYGAAVLWVVIGAVVVFMVTRGAETGLLSVRRVLLWTASIWLWPAFALRRRGTKPPDAPH